MESFILFEDDALLAVNKPASMPVHHTHLPDEQNLQSELEAIYGPLTLLHRLDRDTTGVVLLAKTKPAAKLLSAQFETHRIRKCYWAVVSGQWQPQWNRVETWLMKDTDGRWINSTQTDTGIHARSTVRLLATNGEKSWLEILPKTGRQHQLRLHCLYHHCPILGDLKYGGPPSPFPMALHACRLDFKHPLTHAPLTITALPPAYWKSHYLPDLSIPTSLQALI